jgi:peptidoglycan/LPS O-acetylase OafA/YrhL
MLGLLTKNINPNRVYGLDILRAMAIIFVMLVHGKVYLPDFVQKLHPYIQFDGVSIFFVLSGFLIGGILIKLFETKEITWNLMMHFWLRRWYRTLPNYFLVLVVIILMKNYYEELKDIWTYFIFSQNLWYPHPYFFDEAWSLSIEEWFYLLIPLGCFFLLRIFRMAPKQVILIVALFVLISVTAFRYYRFSTIELETMQDFHRYFRLQVITRLDSLMYGIIGAYLMYYYRNFWFRYKKLFLILGLIILLFMKITYLNGVFPLRKMFNCVFSFSLFSFGILLLLPFLSDLKKGKGVFFKWFTLISLISYSMYLVNHTVVQHHLIDKIPWDEFLNPVVASVIQYLLFWVITIIISMLMYRYFEVPMMNKRDGEKIKKRFPIIPKSTK